MRVLLALALMAMGLAPLPARAAVDAPPIVTEDPAAYAASLMNDMSAHGMAPLRAAYNQIFAQQGGQLPTQIDAALLAYERIVGQNRAVVARVVEDDAISDVFRAIYLYHYFGSNGWVFTRLDFVRVGDHQWALSSVTFSSEWSVVVLTTSPGAQAH